MKVSEVMTKDVKVINLSDSIRKAAQLMKDSDCGALPVESNDKLQGMITDRDITLWLAQSKGSDADDTTVEDCMTEGIKYCYDDQDLETVTNNMGEIQCRRMPVVDRDKKLVGIVSLSDITLAGDSPDSSQQAYQRICS